ncbi:MAG TPA: GMC family oxidoreductase N-terminal domain-containing protein [Steroidobacteraceae bacterium]
MSNGHSRKLQKISRRAYIALNLAALSVRERLTLPAGRSSVDKSAANLDGAKRECLFPFMCRSTISNTADVIVVGSGSAGSTLAGRLAMESQRRVILLEAGGNDWNPAIRRPLLAGILSRWTSLTWPFMTESMPDAAGRALRYPQGRVIGGGSSINGMMYVRGSPVNFDEWAQMGLPAWSWKYVLPAYCRLEAYGGRPSEYRGRNGPLPVTRHPASNVLYRVFLEASQEAGYPLRIDLNSPPFEGVGRSDGTFKDGSRWSAARAFLDPARDRANLRIVTDAQATRLIVSSGKVTGVQALVDGEATLFEADEVVVSAGTVNSPKLLLLSGIGPADHLRSMGISVVADIAGVGMNLQDHVAVRASYRCKQAVTLYPETRIDRAALDFVRAWWFGSGPVSESPFGTMGLLRSLPDSPHVDLLAIFSPILSSATLRLPGVADGHDGDGYVCAAQVCQPESRGSVTLRSADPLAAPRIQPNFLSAPRDLAMLRGGLKIVRGILQQPAFNSYRGQVVDPDVPDNQLDEWIRHHAGPGLHDVGTCKMGAGADSMAVVNSQLQVRGISGLRVADASVMPRVTSGNTNAPSIMIGYRCADFILNTAA